MRCVSLLWFLLIGLTASGAAADDEGIEPFIDWLLDDGERLEDVAFAEVVAEVADREVIPFDESDPTDLEILDHLGATLERMLVDFARADHPLHEIGRINEVSGAVEDFLLQNLGREGRFAVRIPPNAAGDTQRSGYPDIELRHLLSGRVVYIDPKVYREGSEDSSFRSFYFEPKSETNKILEDAHHLVVGLAHGGRVEGRWQLLRWGLVDLSEFRVRLKAEFQASNRDLYQEDAVLRRGAVSRSVPVGEAAVPDG